MILFDVWCETRGVLSPLLFSIYVNDMIQKLCDKSTDVMLAMYIVVVLSMQMI